MYLDCIYHNIIENFNLKDWLYFKHWVQLQQNDKIARCFHGLNLLLKGKETFKLLYLKTLSVFVHSIGQHLYKRELQNQYLINAVACGTASIQLCFNFLQLCFLGGSIVCQNHLSG
jgi:hypothetical protein